MKKTKNTYKKVLMVCMALVLVSVLCIGSVSAAGGSGTESDPYIIETPTELQSIASNTSAYYKLNNDINLSSFSWTSIGTFTGGFDGNGHKITGLTKEMFSRMAGCKFHDVTFENCNVTHGDHYASIVCGGNTNGTSTTIVFDNVDFKNCTMTATGKDGCSLIIGVPAGNFEIKNCDVEDCTITGAHHIGAFCGGYCSNVNSGKFENNTVKGLTINGSNHLGGLFGYANVGNSATLTVTNNSIENIQINGVGEQAGGLIGYANCKIVDNGNTVKTGKINATTGVGGLYGYLADGMDKSIIGSVADNLVIKGTGDNVGGLFGYLTSKYGYSTDNPAIYITNCKSKNNTILGANSVGGLTGYNNLCFADDNGCESRAIYDGCESINNVVNGSGNYVGGLFGMGGYAWKYWDNFGPQAYVELEDCTLQQSTIKGNNCVSIISGYGGIAWQGRSNVASVHSAVMYEGSGNVFETSCVVATQNAYATMETSSNGGRGDMTGTIRDCNVYGGSSSNLANTYLPNLTVSSTTTTAGVTADLSGLTVSYNPTSPDDATKNLVISGIKGAIGNVSGTGLPNGAVWNCGDSTTINTNELSTSHQYTASGDYAPSVVITNYFGDTATATINPPFHVNSIYSPKFRNTTITPMTTQIGQTINISTEPYCDYGTISSSKWEYSTDGGTTWTTLTTSMTYAWVTNVEGVIKLRASATNEYETSTSEVYDLNIYGKYVINSSSVNKTIFVIGEDVIVSGNVVEPTYKAPLSTGQWLISNDGGTSWNFFTNDGVYNKNVTTAGSPEHEYKLKIRCGDATYGYVYGTEYTIQIGKIPKITGVNATPTELKYGDSVSLTSTVTSLSTPSIQWKYSTDNGTTWNDISGATTANYTWTNAPKGDIKVKIDVTNTFGSATANTPDIAVYGTPVIDSSSVVPASVLTNIDPFNMTATVTLDPVKADTPTYQWYMSTDGTTFSPVGSAGLTNSYLPTTDGVYYFKFVVSDRLFTVESPVSTNIAGSVPVISNTSITPNEIKTGDNAVLDATVVSSVVYTSQWKYSTDNGTTWTDISGATTDNYTWNSITTGDYLVKITCTNASGTVDSIPKSLKVYGAPSINVGVNPLSAETGVTTLTLTADVIPDPILADTYAIEWFVDENGGGWTTIGTTTPLSYMPMNNGVYKFKCVVTDRFYSITSAELTVNSNSKPIITNVSSTPSALGEGTNIDLSSTITSSTGSHDTQWKYSTDSGTTWNNISGATTDNFTWTNAPVGNLKVKVTAENVMGTTESTVIGVDVYGAPTITISADEYEKATGEVITLTPTVTPHPVLSDPTYTVSYEVKIGSGAWTSCSSPYTATTENTYKFRGTVTDSYFAITSPEITVNVYDLPNITSAVVSPTYVATGGNINLTATVSSTAPLTTYKWQVSADSGSTWTDVSAGNEYNSTWSSSTSGAYDFKFKAESAVGTSYSTVTTAYVVLPRVVTITVSPSVSEPNNPINLNATVVTPPISALIDTEKWYVSTDSGSTWTDTGLTAETTTYTPTTAGIYQFKFVVTDIIGQVSTSNIESTKVDNKPTVNITVPSIMSINTPTPITATVSSTLPITSQGWYYDDGAYNWTFLGSNLTENVRFTTDGTYHVKFEATNDIGTTTQTATVQAADVPIITNLTAEYASVPYTTEQVIHIETNAMSKNMTTYLNNGYGWEKVDTTWTPEFNGYKGVFKVWITNYVKDADYQCKVTATNSAGGASVDSPIITFHVTVRPDTPFEKDVKGLDNIGGTAIVICALIMLGLVGFLILGIVRGFMDAKNIILTIVLIGIVFVALVLIIVFSGSISSISLGLLDGDKFL